MGVVKNLMVRAGADFSAITKQANRAKTSMSGMQSSVSRSCSLMTASMGKLNKVLSFAGVALSATALIAAAKGAKAAYDEQTTASAKLTQVMRNTMGARADEIASINALINAQENLGVVKGDVQTEAAQELGTYLTQAKSLKTLIPVMNDMVAQQYGLSASAESATSIATMMGKVMNGQTSALSRYGYSFTAAQEAILKFGTEEQRAATLADVVSQSVGGMNAALAATPNGRLVQVSNILGQIQENFGSAVSRITVLFLPALNVVCNVLASMATLANKVAQALSNVFGGTSKSASIAVSYTGAAVNNMEDLTEATGGAGKAASLATFGFDTLQKLSGTSSGGGGSATENVGAGGGVTDVTTGADQAGESIGGLEQKLTDLRNAFSAFDYSSLAGALDRLRESAAPLTQGLFSGLDWAIDNIFLPLSQWTVESALPAFFDTLGGAASLLSSAIDALLPGASWLWSNFLLPAAQWTGGTIVGALSLLTAGLYSVSGWISQNQGLFQGMTLTVGAFFLAWKVATTAEFIVNAGGVAGLVNTMTAAVKAGTVAKLADKAATAAICLLYAKDWVLALAASTVALGRDAAAWILLRAEWAAGKAQIIAVTAAQAAHTVAAWAGTAATTALGAAMAVLTSPITLVIAAIALLAAGVVILVKNWDDVKATASATWENITRVWGKASEWFSKNVTSPISNGFKSFSNGIIGFFEGMVNGAISGINKIMEAFNRISFTAPDWVPVIGGKSWGFKFKTLSPIALPRLANGAVFPGNNPYMAIVNDQKHGVNVESPLSTIVDAMMIALRSSDFGGGDISVNVNAVFEGQLAALARYMRPYFEADAKRVGTRASTKGVI